MKPVQRCWVCGTEGYLTDGPVVVSSAESPGPPSIGQCPRCLRFICSHHGELLDLEAERSWRPRGSKPGTLTICCPFDRGVPLGR